MKAIIPVAGIGTRLRPHTYTHPKPLIPVAGKPILSYIIEHLLNENIDEFVFIIFNRWGEEIFKTTDLQFTWDGKHKGNLVEVGAYPYTVRVKTDNGFTSEKQGHVNVLR